MITRLLATGKIARIRRNRYCVAESLKTYHFPHSGFAVSVADEITGAHLYLDFRIFELVQLNEFVNHQIAHNIVFVSVEGELEENVFNTLWKKHKGSVLFKPDADELFRYLNEDRENYGEEHIRELQSKSRKDPQLIERALYALLKHVSFMNEHACTVF